MKNMIAYHGKKSLKTNTMKIVETHRLADTLQQRMIGQDGKGCAVWCTVGAYRHDDYETKLGIPVELAVFEDRIFESLPVAAAKLWPSQFLGAIQPGADLSLVFPQLYYWIWTNPEIGIMRHVTDDEERVILEEGLGIFARWGAGNKPSETEFRKAIEKLRDLARALARALDLALALARARDLALALARALDLALDRARALDRPKFYAAVAAKMVELLAAAPIAEAVE
ncbi:hypothetical protein BH09VER1_BH09VER1_28800 [soil metagenome]